MIYGQFIFCKVEESIWHSLITKSTVWTNFIIVIVFQKISSEGQCLSLTPALVHKTQILVMLEYQNWKLSPCLLSCLYKHRYVELSVIILVSSFHLSYESISPHLEVVLLDLRFCWKPLLEYSQWILIVVSRECFPQNWKFLLLARKSKLL